MKNVAFTHSAASASRTLALLPWTGPSSNVRTTSRFFRRNDSAYCSVPMRGKSDVLTEIVRLVPRTSGLLVQLGPAHAAEVPANMPPATTATLTSFEIRTNFNMSFCSGLLEGAATYRFAGEWYGDAGLNITAVRELATRPSLVKTNRVNATPASL